MPGGINPEVPLESRRRGGVKQLAMMKRNDAVFAAVDHQNGAGNLGYFFQIVELVAGQ